MKYIFYYDFCNGKVNNLPNLEWSSIGFEENEVFYDSNKKLVRFHNLKKGIISNKKINLSKDLILPWPWKQERLIGTITKIGEGRIWGKWTQDYNNHFVEVWLPMGIAWVYGGNHSITIGIIQGGELTPEYYYDISEVYQYIRCDGENFIEIASNKIISPVINIEFASIFEIGRLLDERGISFID